MCTLFTSTVVVKVILNQVSPTSLHLRKVETIDNYRLKYEVQPGGKTPTTQEKADCAYPRNVPGKCEDDKERRLRKSESLLKKDQNAAQ